jgi:DNA-binding transcriptional ArsR family regulator
LTRQAITKHLRVLESVGVVRSVRRGRESLFEFKREPIEEIRKYLDLVSAQWDQALGRLKSFVED